MRKIYKYCLIYSVFLFSTSQVFASHIMGMDLSFTCKGGDTITFTLNFYRDCAGVAPSIKPLYIQSASHNYYNTINLNEVGTPIDISPLCPKDLDSSTCFDPKSTLPGAQDWVYQGTFVLPYAANDWVFYYDDEARNAAITTILDPGNTGIRVKDSLDNTTVQCVSSPIFSNVPVPYVCSDNPCTYNHGGYDPDGDSMSYELVSPEDQNGDPVVYVNGLSYDSVLIEQTGAPYSLNPATGQLSFTPLLGSQQITVTAVRIYYYYQGKVIGYVTRDIEIIVRDCTNTAPFTGGIQDLVGGGLTGPSSFTLCANTNTSFQITAKDTDLPSEAIAVSTNANLVLPGSTVTLTDTNPVYIHFTWSPTDADTGYHNFTITLKNDFCPIYGVSVYSYQIYVAASTFAEPGTTLCQGQSTELNATGGNHFVWTPSAGLNNPDTSSPIATPTITTSYIVTSNLTSLCKNKDTVVVVVQLPFSVSINADTGRICPGTLTPLSAVTKGGSGVSPYTYSWTSSPPGFTSTSASISDTPKVPTIYHVMVQNGPCSDSTSFRLNIDTTANATFAVKDTVCAGQQYIVTYLGHSPLNAAFNWSFNGGTILSGSGRGPYLVDYLYPGGPYTMSLTVTNTDNCSDFQTKNIFVGTPFTVSITADSTICRTSSTTLTPSISGGGSNGAYNYTWTSNPTGFSSDSTSPIVTPTYTTTYHVLSESYGCSDTSSFTVAVDSNALATFAAIDTVCQSEPFSINFQGYSQVAAQFKWGFDGGTVVSGSGSGPYNISYPTSGIHKISLLVTNPDGCTDSSSANVYVAVPFNVKISGDTIVCPSYSATLGTTTIGGSDNPYSYSWKSNPLGFSSSSPNPVVTPVGTTTYYVLAQSKTGCVDSAAFVVRVDSLSNSRFSIPDTACVNEQFSANYTGISPKNSQYAWTFNGGNIITGSGIGPYTLQYSTGGLYRIALNVTDSFGCSDTSSRDIFIQPLPNDTFSASPRIGCEPSTVSFSVNAVAGSTFSWSFGDGDNSIQQNPTHTYKHGIYTVTITVTDKFGCIQTYTQQNYITVDTSVIAAFTVNADTGSLYDYTNNNFQFTNKSKYASFYTWYFGDGATGTEVNPSHSYKAMGDYYVELIACDSLGCCDTTTFGPIHLRNLNDFYLPGAFTPMGDKNNRFHILGFGLTDAELRVYNRWGELIWQGSGATATDVNEGWDGTYNGKSLPMGTYVWYATATLGTGKPVTKKGNVMLIR